MMKLLLYLAFIISSVDAKSNNNETLKVRLNLPFFTFFSKNGHHVVDEEIPKITIPKITLPFTTSVGTGEVSTNELKIEKFRTPKIDFKLSDSGISWWTKFGAVRLKGLWKASFTELITVSDSGWLNVLATDIRMNISASVYELDGQPQVSIGSCDVDIIHLDVEIGGSVISWLVNLFRSPLSNVVKQVIHSQACIAAKGILLDEANRFLHTLPSHIDIGKNFYVDYFLLQNPTSTSESAEFDLAADIIYGKSKCNPVKDFDWKDGGSNPGMVTSWLSVSVPNCLIESAHKNQLVRLLVSKDIASVEPYLKTSCGFLSICIGKFFSKLRAKYPNQYIDLYFHTFETPYFVMSEKEGVILNMSLAVDFYINPFEKTKKNVLARLVVDTSSDVQPYLNHSRIYGEIKNMAVSAREEFSNIGDVSESFLRTFSSILSMTAKQAVRGILAVGIPIPSVDNVTLADSSKIEIFDRYARLNVDFEYK